LFIGVYRVDGTVVCERACARRPDESMGQALVWGVKYGRQVVVDEAMVISEADGV